MRIGHRSQTRVPASPDVDQTVREGHHGVAFSGLKVRDSGDLAPLVSFEVEGPKVLDDNLVAGAAVEEELVAQTNAGMRVPAGRMFGGGSIESFPLEGNAVHAINLLPLPGIFGFAATAKDVHKLIVEHGSVPPSATWVVGGLAFVN